jgi:hypothetical protein
MHTRREILQQALFAPVAARLGNGSGVRIFAAPDCLSQESAAGFRSALAAHAPRNLIVLCGIAALQSALDLRRYAWNGGWILCEPPPDCSAIPVSTDHLYIRYRWPRPTLTRAFSSVTPVRCQPHEAIAHYRDIPVALRRRIGSGGMIVLGSMLGPNLNAGEPQAQAILKSMC